MVNEGSILMQKPEEEEWGSIEQKGGQYGLSGEQVGIVYSELELLQAPESQGL